MESSKGKGFKITALNRRVACSKYMYVPTHRTIWRYCIALCHFDATGLFTNFPVWGRRFNEVEGNFIALFSFTFSIFVERCFILDASIFLEPNNSILHRLIGTCRLEFRFLYIAIFQYGRLRETPLGEFTTPDVSDVPVLVLATERLISSQPSR